MKCHLCNLEVKSPTAVMHCDQAYRAGRSDGQGKARRAALDEAIAAMDEIRGRAEKLGGTIGANGAEMAAYARVRSRLLALRDR